MNTCNPIFIGHGSPMNAIRDNRYSRFLSAYAQLIPVPEAIVVISAHWETIGSRITGRDSPEQIYDFWGFPQELYNVRYAPKGFSKLAERISHSVPDIEIDYERGLDHAAWAVVRHMYPEEKVPVLEISLDRNKSPAEHFELGGILFNKTEGKILFIGSGNVVHNLRQISYADDVPPYQWAVAADEWINDQVTDNNISHLVNYVDFMPDYRRAIPTSEHYLPFLYILGMCEGKDKIKTIYQEIQNGSISMRCIEIEKTYRAGTAADFSQR